MSLKDPLRAFEVIDRLEIGPVRVERNRLVAPYRVTQGRKSDSINLIYRYEEDVFQPGDSQSQNLANMVAAQVALNYGLFCREIIFHGWFDQHDKRLIVDMASNTAREIYVKKLLEHNPFLVGGVAALPVVKKNNYLRSKIIFDNNNCQNASAGEWDVDAGRCCVLSSGGKDSLLSFGLLDELKYDVHPIYINESGRHWYTALNAYRYFKHRYPSTSRVWTNADRIFNWMLRHLPFIRKDFASIRADEYPIRLWTVAVFLFGALPLLRKRGIGRLVIGDEYDTTRRLRYEGISHYDGLYDQSRYFDKALSRYYARKGWGIRQFSIIRPLSEMLIEKILVERYPELQRQQVSCHATHIAGNRVLPCGDCEKCRRIVGMLLALGADPRRCGYTNQQIRKVLQNLSGTSLRQDAASAEHLRFMLAKKGLIPGSTSGQPHSQIMKLMLDPEKSPADEIPDDLRSHLFRLCLDHADGMVRRHGKDWINADFKGISTE